MANTKDKSVYVPKFDQDYVPEEPENELPSFLPEYNESDFNLEHEYQNKQPEKDIMFESFATLTALRGTQFGKEVFSALLKFKELRQFLQVFPEVQRSANGRKIGSIKNYILSGLDGDKVRFFSSLTASTRGEIFYDENNKRVAIHTQKSKLSVNDGQHVRP